MDNSEKLKQARNLIRYIFKKFNNELDVKFRENPHLFFDLMKRCIDVGVIEDDHQGRYMLTLPCLPYPYPLKTDPTTASKAAFGIDQSGG